MHYFDKNNNDLSEYPKVVILAAGEMPNPKTLGYNILEEAATTNNKTLICCDGACNRLFKMGYPLPDVVVGDLDSIRSDYKEQLGSRLHNVSDQDTNDLTKSIKYFVSHYDHKEVCILALTGLREDHSIANMSLLPTYVKLGVDKIIVPTNYGVMYCFRGKAKFEAPKGTQISIFTFDRSAVTTHGLCWELNHQILQELWMGTLNEVKNGCFDIESDQPLVVYILDEIKHHHSKSDKI